MMAGTQKVFIKTYGCQMNERDSETIASKLRQSGYIIVTDEKLADIVILNTCSVREQAEIKAIGKAGHLSKRKSPNPKFKLGIVGCMAENLGEKLFRLNPAIDFVIGPQRISELPYALKKDAPALLVGPPARIDADRNFGRNLEANKCTAFLSIMHGCNMRCSYCIVPKTRGQEWYRPMQDILDEAKSLAANGIKEITLLGQIVNNYGRGKFPICNGQTPFVQLLHKLNAIDGIMRIRYLSPHPTYFSDDLVEAHKTLRILCSAVHLPVQSGSNQILKMMKRPYTREKILEIIKKLRNAVPNISISTDIIVGYPGETEAQFEETASLLDTVKFNMAFIFKYSPRPGTKAAETLDDVPNDEKERRNRILLAQVEANSRYHNQNLLGAVVEVLVEGNAKRGKDIMFGWTPNRYKILFEGTTDLVGRTISVKVDSFSTAALCGKIINSI